jgi:surface glycoprotein (TIGR04207 family)
MNEQNTTYREKGRAVFLAAIMVLSVVAFTASFGAAPAAANSSPSGAHTVTGVTVTDVTGGQASTNQTVTINLDVDGGQADDIITIDASNLTGAGVSINAANVTSESSNINATDTGFNGTASDLSSGTLAYDVNRSSSATGESITVSVDLDTPSASVSSVTHNVTNGDDSSNAVDSFNHVSATGATANDIDVSAGEESVFVNVTHSDSVNEGTNDVRIALFHDNLNVSLVNATSSNANVAVNNSGTGFTEYEVNLSSDTGDALPVGDWSVYAAAQADDDEFGEVNESNFQQEDSVTVDGVQVTDIDGTSVSPNAQNVTYDVTVQNTGSQDVSDWDVDILTPSAGGGIGDFNPTGDSANTFTNNGSIDAGTSETITVEFNTSDLAGSSGSSVQTYQIRAFTDGSPYSLGSNQTLQVGTNNADGAIEVEVTDTGNNPVEDARVELYRGSEDPSNLIAVAEDVSGGPSDNFVRFDENFDTGGDWNVVTNNIGNSGLAIGPDSGNATEYVVNVSKAGFQADLRSGELHEQNVEATLFPSLQRLISVDNFDLVQNDNSALADGEDTITWDLEQVYQDFDEDGNGQLDDPVDFTTTFELTVDNPSEIDGDVDVSADGVSLGNIGDGSTVQVTFDPSTDGPNSPVTISATSTDNTEVEFNFTNEDNRAATDNLNPYNDGPGVRLKQYVIAGDGSIDGTVYDETTTNPIESANVWAVPSSTYEAQQTTFRIDLDDVDNAVDEYDAETNENVAADSAWIRLVDNETGQVIDNKMYDVRAADSRESVDLRAVRQLDQDDIRQGSGYYVENRSDGEFLNISVATLEPGDYKLDVSLGGENSSDGTLSDNVPANFTRAEGTGDITDGETLTNWAPAEEVDVPTDTITGQPEALVQTQNMTLADAIARSESSDGPDDIRGTNWVDSPGWENSYEQNTEGTNENGQFLLNRLPVNFQQGQQLVLIAEKSGYTSDFADAFVSEDGDYRFNETQGPSDLTLEPIDPTPDIVNITNLGVHPPTSTTGGAPDFSQINFDETTTIPRDESVDVMLVQTYFDGSEPAEDRLIGTGVDLEIPEDGPTTDESRNMTADVIAVFGGSETSDPAGDLGSVDTSGTATLSSIDLDLDDGEALVLIETDESQVNFGRDDTTDNSGPNEAPTNETGIFAQLEDDATGTDFVEKNFPGIVTFESGSISGIISNDDSLLPNTFVWTAQFVTDGSGVGSGTLFEIEPNFGDTSGISSFADIQDSSDVESLMFDIMVDGTLEATVSGDELRSIDLGSRISTVSADSASNFNLLRHAGDHTNGDYSMDRVPAQDLSPSTPSTGGVDYTKLTAVQYQSGNTGNGSSSNPVRPGFTQEGNVVITEATPLDNGTDDDTALENYDDNGDGVLDNDEIFDAVQDWQDGAGYFADLSDDEANNVIFDLVQNWQDNQ